MIFTTGFAGTFKTNQGAPPKQKAGKSFDIFCDENVPPSLQPQQTDEWQSLPVKAVTNRENEKKPGIWKGVKVGNLMPYCVTMWCVKSYT